MKKNSIVLILLAALGLVTSCATDELVNPATPTPGQQVTITATLGNGGDNSSNSNPGNGSTDKPGTRMGYKPDDAGTGLKTTWATGDAFNIIPIGSNKEEGTAKLFTLDEASVGNSEGTFNGTAPDKGDKYRIYHPTSITTLAKFDAFSYTRQVQTGNGQQSHLTAYHAMAFSTTDYTTIAFSGTNFSQSACMKFVLTLPDAITPTKITLATADNIEHFYSNNTSSAPIASLSLDLKEFGKIAAGTPITAYMMMSCQRVTLPAAGIIVTVDAADGSSYTQTIATPSVEGKAVTLSGGKMHTITAKNMKKVVLPSMKFTVKVTESDKTFNIPFCIGGITPAAMTVDWGDGSISNVPAGTTLSANDAFKHTYNDASAEGTEYTITITSAQADATEQQIPKIDFYNYRTGNDNPLKLISIETPLLNTGTTDFSDCFSECTALTTIPADLFKYNTAATDFSGCFYGCTALTKIPEGLFDNNTAATNFIYCFSECTAFTAIPADLFKYNTAATSFGSCFSGCTALTTIPEGLFASNTEATNFSSCFYDCRLAKLNAKIFSMDGNTNPETNTRFSGKEMNFSQCFYYAGSELTDVTGSVAPQLWKYDGAGTDTTWTMGDCFTNCNASNSWEGMDTAAWGIPAN